MHRLPKVFLIFSLITTVFLQAPPVFSKIAFLGDSLTTGGGAHPKHEFDFLKIWEFLTGNASTVPDRDTYSTLDANFKNTDFSPPVRLWRTPREFYNGGDWVFRNLLNTLSHFFLDAEGLSWGFLLAKKLGYSSQDILIAGEDGAKVEAISKQVERVLAHTKSHLPEKIFVFFTGNDLCAPHQNLITQPNEYSSSLASGLKYLVRNGTPSMEGSKVYILGNLNITQILTSTDILEHKVKAHGGEITCQQLRVKNYLNDNPTSTMNLPPEGLYLSQFVPPNPAQICPTIFAQKLLAQRTMGLIEKMQSNDIERTLQKKVEEQLSNLANQVRSFRRISKEKVDEVNQWALKNYPEKKIKFYYLNQTEHIKFKGEDMAHDCFHLSSIGHLKVANSIFDQLQKSNL